MDEVTIPAEGEHAETDNVHFDTEKTQVEKKTNRGRKKSRRNINKKVSAVKINEQFSDKEQSGIDQRKNQ
jgi:hypothetical protein